MGIKIKRPKGADTAAGISTEDLEKELAYRRTGADFPLHVFNPAIRNICTEAVENYKVPRAFAGLSVLCATSTAVGSAYWVAAGEFTDPLTLWGSMVGISSQGKSLSEKIFFKPIKEIQSDLDAEFERNKQETEMVNDSPDNKHKQPWERERAKRPTLLNQSDTTFEAFIRQTLLDNPKGICKSVEEQIEWINAMALYAKGDGIEKQFWLKAWTPSSPFIQTRSGKETLIKKEHLVVNVYGGTQPALLYKFFDKGMLEMGMSNRILFAIPMDYQLHAPNYIYRIPTDVASAYSQALKRLYYELPMRGTFATPYFAELSTPALKLLGNFNKEMLAKVNKISESGDMARSSAMSGAMGKINQYTNRFAVLLFLQDAAATGQDLQGLTNVSPEYAERAIELGKYFFSTFEQAYDIALNTLQIPSDVLQIAAYMKACEFNITKAAEKAGMAYKTFYNHYQKALKKYPKAFGAKND